MISVPMDIGSHINCTKGGVPAIASGTDAGTTQTGFDRTGFESCVLAANVGAATGTPDSFTVDMKLQHSDVVGSGYVDFTPNTGSAAIAQATAAGFKSVNINLLGAKQFIAVKTTVAFVNGTSPKVPIAATLVMGGAVTEPA